MAQSSDYATKEQDQPEHLVRKFYSTAEQWAHTTDSPNLIKRSQGCKFGGHKQSPWIPTQKLLPTQLFPFFPKVLWLEYVFEDW